MIYGIIDVATIATITTRIKGKEFLVNPELRKEVVNKVSRPEMVLVREVIMLAVITPTEMPDLVSIKVTGLLLWQKLSQQKKKLKTKSEKP